ncbi:MAG: molybdate ABC transporter permease subunit [Gemmatimonadetes bacterium]|nr:molybdate ABC transporter permease subunit [Gemmatimonadota bacterium]
MLVYLCMGVSWAPAALSGQAPAPASSQDPILVLAAASLTDALPAVAKLWEATGGAPVQFSFAATSRLAPLAIQGNADLFISADQEWMDWVVERAGARVEDVVPLLGNSLVVAVPAGTTAPPRTLADLASLPRLALAGETVPAGRYARAALEAAGVWDSVAERVVRGESVRSTLEWVARGEAAAGIVYRTDVPVTPGVELAFEIPAAMSPAIVYPGVVLANAPNPAAAAGFLAFLGTAPVQDVFAAAGFDPVGRPPAAPPTPQVTGAPIAEPIADPASAIMLSLVVGLAATLLGLVPSVLLGRLLARREFPGKTVVSTLILMPLVLPPVVTGFLLLSLLGTRGTFGPALAAMGISVPFTLIAPIVAAVVVGLPFYVLSARGAFEAVDARLEEVSWTLGVRPRATFFLVALPLAVPGIAAGAVLAFARALGEFGATIVLAGNVEGRTRTIPLAVYSLLESPGGSQAAWLLAGASVLLSLLALAGFEVLSRRQKKRLEEWAGR